MYCAEKVVSTCLRAGFVSAERVEQREVGQREVGKQEVGEVTHRVTCTWWLLGLALKEALLGLGGPPPALTAWTGCMTTDSADY